MYHYKLSVTTKQLCDHGWFVSRRHTHETPRFKHVFVLETPHARIIDGVNTHPSTAAAMSAFVATNVGSEESDCDLYLLHTHAAARSAHPLQLVRGSRHAFTYDGVSAQPNAMAVRSALVRTTNCGTGAVTGIFDTEAEDRRGIGSDFSIVERDTFCSSARVDDGGGGGTWAAIFSDAKTSSGAGDAADAADGGAGNDTGASGNGNGGSGGSGSAGSAGSAGGAGTATDSAHGAGG